MVLIWYEEWRRKVTTVHHLFKPYICRRFRFLRDKFLAFDFKAFATVSGVFDCHAKFIDACQQSEIIPVEPGQGNACKGGAAKKAAVVMLSLTKHTFLNSISLLFFNL